MRMLVVVPAFNLAGTIGPLLERIVRRAPEGDVLLVDDGSTDDTAKRAGEVAGVRVVRHGTNRGKGAALRSGFAAAIEEGYDGVITLDGDGQHPPEAISLLTARREKTGADLIVGARRRRRTKMPLHRRLSNTITSSIASRLAGRKLPDSQSGCRWIGVNVLERVELVTGHYEMETELLIKAARAGFRLDSVEIPTVYAGEASHIHPVRDTVRFLRLVHALRKED